MQHMMHTHQCQKQCIKQARRGRQARRGWPRKASGPRGRRPAGGALRKRVRVLPRVGQHLARQRGQVAEQVQGCRARRRPHGWPPLRAAAPARRMRVRRRRLAGRALRRRAPRLSAPAVPCHGPGPGSQCHNRQSRQDLQGRQARKRARQQGTHAGWCSEGTSHWLWSAPPFYARLRDSSAGSASQPRHNLRVVGRRRPCCRKT